MKNEAWIEMLKVGDEVGVRGYGMNRNTYEIWVVTQVTKQHGGTVYARRKGLDYQTPSRFDMRGWERGVERHSYSLFFVELTQEVKDEIRRAVLLAWLEKTFDGRSQETEKIPLTSLEMAVTLLKEALKRTEADPSTSSDPPSG